MPGRILIVDDEPLKRISLQIELSEAGYEVYEAADALAARRIFDAHPIDVVVSDVRMPGMNGLELLAYVKQIRPDVEVILMTAYAAVDQAVLAVKRGAHDYITKPFTTQELLSKLERLFATRAPTEPQEGVESFGAFLARSTTSKRVITRLRSAAATERHVLISGESGTGKDLLVEAVHNASARCGKPLVRFVCTGVSPTVLDMELFGVEKTEGLRRLSCRLDQADGSSLALEDVADLPPEAQARLLRLIETGEVERHGAPSARFDVRLLCVTRQDLLRAVREGRFREDLYHRLNETSVTVPPLRERPEDIALLARHFVATHAAAVAHGEGTAGAEPAAVASAEPAEAVGARGAASARSSAARAAHGGPSISSAAMDELVRYHWPGNVRELEHVIERGLAFSGGGDIRPEHILPLSREASDAVAPPPLELAELGSLGLSETMSDIERRLIQMALRQCNGNQARAAQRLGIPRTTLRDKMAKYNIPTE